MSSPRVTPEMVEAVAKALWDVEHRDDSVMAGRTWQTAQSVSMYYHEVAHQRWVAHTAVEAALSVDGERKIQAAKWVIEVCNTCDGLVGWERYRDGCCLGGLICRREAGTHMVEVVSVDGWETEYRHTADEAVSLLRELGDDLRRFYAPEKGLPPHLDAIERVCSDLKHGPWTPIEKGDGECRTTRRDFARKRETAMPDLSPAEREANRLLLRHKGGDCDCPFPNECLFDAAYREVHQKFVGPLGVRLNDAERDREAAEDRIRVLEEALQAESDLVERQQSALPSHPEYRVAPGAQHEWLRLENRLGKMRAALSTSAGSVSDES